MGQQVARTDDDLTFWPAFGLAWLLLFGTIGWWLLGWVIPNDPAWLFYLLAVPHVLATLILGFCTLGAWSALRYVED